MTTTQTRPPTPTVDLTHLPDGAPLPFAVRARILLARLWARLPRDRSRRTITPWGWSGRTYFDPGLGGVIAFFVVALGLAGAAGLAAAGWF